MISIKNLLAEQPATASAPCRIDAGGTWDIKAMAMPLQKIAPITINIALSLRTSVVLSPYQDGWVKISSKGFRLRHAFPKDHLPFNSPFGILFGAVSYFGFHGLEAHIRSSSPVNSALGGSSVALVALIKALSKCAARLGAENLSPRAILHIAYHLEDGIAGGNCGIQDQAAAVYGGVNQWKWQYGHPGIPFKRSSLLDRRGRENLTRHLLVAYSGQSHVSSKINRKWIEGFLSGRTRTGWVRVNKIVHRLGAAIRGQNWHQAAGLLREEMALRREITPEALIPITCKLMGQAERLGCGARFAGAGAGGSLWALGEDARIRELHKLWKTTLAPVRGARILDCEVDASGVE